MRVLLLGAGGMLGHDLVATRPLGVDLIALSRADLDITDEESMRHRVAGERPEVIVNAAAYTMVDAAEREPDVAFRVNSRAVGALAGKAAAAGALVVHFSTDYVFDGTASLPYSEDAQPNPLNTYGASKLAGEVRLLQSGARYLLIRTQWLFGCHGRSFPRTMRERALRGERTKVVTDQIGHPTYTKDLAHSVWLLLSRGATGILHVANRGTASWFDVAARVFARAGPVDLLDGCATADYPTAACRPLRSILDTRRAQEFLPTELPHWEEALNRFLYELETSEMRRVTENRGGHRGS